MPKPARRPAASWCQAMLPGSRSPRAREPMTKSQRPARIGSTSAAMLAGSSAPSPSMKTRMSASSAATAAVRHARPYPLPAATTSAPAVLARSTVASLLPPSATITRRTRSRGSRRTTSPIEASSLSVGITTTTAPSPLGAGRRDRWRR